MWHDLSQELLFLLLRKADLHNFQNLNVTIKNLTGEKMNLKANVLYTHKEYGVLSQISQSVMRSEKNVFMAIYKVEQLLGMQN